MTHDQQQIHALAEVAGLTLLEGFDGHFLILRDGTRFYSSCTYQEAYAFIYGWKAARDETKRAKESPEVKQA